MLRTDVRDRGAPWVALMLREKEVPATLNLGWRHRLSAALVLAGAGAVAARRRGPALAILAAISLLNRRFYKLLWRQGGPGLAAAGVGLHAAHHLAAAAAVPVGILLYARTG
jgi:hypothetical protein